MNITLDESDRGEILRYLGYRGSEITDVVENKITEAIELSNAVMTPRCVWRMFSVAEKEEGLSLDETGVFLKGESIKKHLRGFDKVILFCVTVGSDFDREVEKRMVTDPTLAVILNACGIQAVEKTADAVEREAGVTLNGTTGVRFSPGYGDMPLGDQPDFLRLLNAERMVGVSVNKNNLMSPLKSVTAVCGFREN